MSVGIVVVSHVGRIADGIVELAAQMAASVRIVAAGGTDDGGVGTSFDRVLAAIGEADGANGDAARSDGGGGGRGASGDGEAAGGDGVVVLCDLGSAVLTAETALEFLDDEVRARVRIADSPIVEGTVAAAVAAASGADLAGVLDAAESANRGRPGDRGPSSPAPGADGAEAASTPEVAPGVSRTVTLVNRDGLHARPAAEFVTLAARFDAEVTVNGIDATSLLNIMSLALVAGSEVTIAATGAEAGDAVDSLAGLIESGFGE
ncbi:HPr family phosphocarrier protein [Marisediminicola senii]|uniref:HPr family phosphocarrier protein n=1 Tax=Marisediminicola senii TaxID=2711233 RepID=UPI0013EC2F6F|nr:HPr family phosphocarrier protein [Marisediminicola senii]